MASIRFFALISAFALGAATARAGGFAHCLPGAATFRGSYPTKEMVDGAFAEDLKMNVRYYTPAEKEAARIQIVDGLIRTSDGKLANFRSLDNHGYVMDETGAFFDFRARAKNQNRHSVPLRGGPAAGAGGWIVRNGVLGYITAGSGHYQPPEEFLQQTLAALYRAGVQLERVTFSLFDEALVTSRNTSYAEELLFRGAPAVSCIEETLRDPTRATAEGIRLLGIQDLDRLHGFIDRVEREGKLELYRKPIAEAFSAMPNQWAELKPSQREFFKEEIRQGQPLYRVKICALNAVKALARALKR